MIASNMMIPLLALLVSAPLQVSGAEPVWGFVDFGESIGASDILVHSGIHGPELFVTMSYNSGSTTSEYWYVLRRRHDRSPCKFVSPLQYDIVGLALGDVLGLGRPQFAVLRRTGTVDLYDPDTREELGHIPLNITDPLDIALGDSDLDGRVEIHVSGRSDLRVFDPAGALEWSSIRGRGEDLFVLQLDGDPALEIVARDASVVDGVTRQLEWTLPMPPLRMTAADFDGDGMAEVAVEDFSLVLRLYDVDLRSERWNRPVLFSERLAAGDLDGDSIPEILVGEAGTGGSILAIEGGAGAEIGRIAHQGDGITSLLAADVDQDGQEEVIWGSERFFRDKLMIADGRTAAVEWQSESYPGPFSGPRLGDLDGDGRPEVVVACGRSALDDVRLLVFDAKDLDLLAVSDPIAGGAMIYEGIEDLELRDLDGDGTQEILTSMALDLEAVLMAFHYSGGRFTQVWTNPTRLTDLSFTQVDAVDLDHDGRMEVLGATGNTTTRRLDVAVYVYDHPTGQLLWQTPAVGSRLDSVDGMEIRDFDQDGNEEIATFTAGRSVFIFDPVTRQTELEIPGSYHWGLDSFDFGGSPTLAIIQQDGGLQSWQWVRGAYRLIRRDPLPVGAFMLDPAPLDRLWVASDQLQLLDLRSHAVLWTAPNLLFSGSAVPHSPYDRRKFLAVARFGLYGFCAR